MTSLRDSLERGETVTGMINFIGHPMAVEIMARAGFDFAVIDMEHCPLDLGDLAHIVRAADAAGIAPLVRLPDLDRALTRRVLNLGVHGLVLPHASLERCQQLLDAALYPPSGRRGACPIVRASRYWPDDWREHSDRTNRELFIMPLVEDAEAVAEFGSMAELPEISAFFVGPYDLSVSIGVPGASFDHPGMMAALSTVLHHARRCGKHIFTTVGDRQEKAYSRKLLDAGVSGLVFATDALVFLQACRRLASFSADTDD